MNREHRYIVFKIKDLENIPLGMTENERDTLAELAEILPKRNYVVVEDDWPEYEVVWKMIEKRVDEQNRVD